MSEKFSDCNCSALRQAARSATQLYDSALAPSGLRTSQYSILKRMSWRGPLTMNVLADELAMDRTTLSRNVLPLERDGLISILPNPQDRRAKDLHLTPLGRRRFEAAKKYWAGAQEKFEDIFGRKRSVELREELHRVVEKVGEAHVANE